MNPVKIFLQATFICFACISFGFAQKIEGKVTDASGNPIEGASIIIKYSRSGTTTDASGNFSIAAKVNDVLVFTATGYAIREVRIRDNTPINVVMQSQITALDQIVLLGSRRGGRVKTESPVPVDVINLETTKLTSARPDVTSLLNYSAPSFNYNKQSGSD